MNQVNTACQTLTKYNKSLQANQRREYLELSSAKVGVRQSFWLAGAMVMLPVADALQEAIDDYLPAICQAVFGTEPHEPVDTSEVIDWMLADQKFGFLMQLECPRPDGALVNFWLYHESIQQLVQEAIATATAIKGQNHA